MKAKFETGFKLFPFKLSQTLHTLSSDDICSISVNHVHCTLPLLILRKPSFWSAGKAYSPYCIGVGLPQRLFF